ncbi:MAG: chemotaxis protein CheR [Alphaproteobacteria bacterium]|nr:MAG: chemotaxis protein CheR [Alphaproteobacteria bacterium]
MAFTFFFRDLDAIKLIPDYVLPNISEKKAIKMWDAGCANGSEIYSILIHLKETLDEEQFKKIKIFASDIDNSNRFKKIIEEGTYKKNQISSIPSDILKKYFVQNTENPDIYIVSENLREKVSYQKHDLLSLNAIGHDFDLIICKHVLQHFNNKEQVDVIKMFHNSLADEGFLLCEYSQEIPEYLSSRFTRILPEKNLYRKTSSANKKRV